MDFQSWENPIEIQVFLLVIWLNFVGTGLLKFLSFRHSFNSVEDWSLTNLFWHHASATNLSPTWCLFCLKIIPQTHHLDVSRLMISRSPPQLIFCPVKSLMERWTLRSRPFFVTRRSRWKRPVFDGWNHDFSCFKNRKGHRWTSFRVFKFGWVHFCWWIPVIAKLADECPVFLYRPRSFLQHHYPSLEKFVQTLERQT